MAGVSNPTTRVIDVLNFLAAHPTESFSLAEIARHAGLSKASAHRILVTLTEAKILSRHPSHKTFSLGVAAVAIGEAALEKHRGIEVARREIAKLAIELNLQCEVSAIVDEDLLLLAKDGSPQFNGVTHRVGERTPLVPPVAIALMPWSSPEQLDTYVTRCASQLSNELLDYLQYALTVIRQRGYSIVEIGPALKNLRTISHLPYGKTHDDAYWESLNALVGSLTKEEIQLCDLNEGFSHSVSHISAPIFTPSGSAYMELGMTGMLPSLSAAKVEEYAERIRTAASVVTNAIRGKAPVFKPNK